MIRVRQVEVLINNNTLNDIIYSCSKKLGILSSDILNISINRQSIDARKKPNIYYIYELDVEVKNEEKILKRNKSNDVLLTPNEKFKFLITGNTKLNKRPIIIGAGPAGLFCAYMLAKNGYRPLILERGEKIEKRVKDVEKFWKTGILNTNSNVQYGEGGAGTFSDGKLNTQVKDPLFIKKEVLDIFVLNGADKRITYEYKPHIGTDLLRNIIINIRNKIIEYGGEFRYNSCLTDIFISDNEIESIEVNNEIVLPCEVLVLATGHSARDTYEMLMNRKISMEAKPFAVGIRIQHKQEMINLSQYGSKYNEILSAASYKLIHKSSNGRGVYSFCMCPGGYVVNSSSEEKYLSINGMSNSTRDTENANSAIIVTIGPDDYGNNPLDGIKFQRELERKSYLISNGKIPVQLFKDYKLNKKSEFLGKIKPIFKGEYELSNLNLIFPDYINESLKEAIEEFEKKIKGFSSGDAILSAVESRTSSPIRITRNEYGKSNIDGIFPVGEGAGYAGGIISSAMDGIKVAQNIAKIYTNIDKF